jgi:hypothetical protein
MDPKSMVRSLPQIGAWRSLVARLLWEQEVGGSNPLAPTNKIKNIRNADFAQNRRCCVLFPFHKNALIPHDYHGAIEKKTQPHFF